MSRDGVVFNEPTTIRAETIISTGTIIGRDNATITLNANSNITTDNIPAPAGINITSTQGNIKTGDVVTNSSDNRAGDIDIVSSSGF